MTVLEYPMQESKCQGHPSFVLGNGGLLRLYIIWALRPCFIKLLLIPTVAVPFEVLYKPTQYIRRRGRLKSTDIE